MNWNQLYTSSTPEERLEAVMLMLSTIEERKQRLILSRGRLVREKRGNFPGAHFINDRRRLRRSLPSTISKLSFGFILTTVSTATWLFFIHAPSDLAAPTLLFHLVSIMAILLIRRKPIFRQRFYWGNHLLR